MRRGWNAKYHIVTTIRCTCHTVNHHTLHLPHGAPTTQCTHHMVHLQHSAPTTWCTYLTLHLPHSTPTTQWTNPGPLPTTQCTEPGLSPTTQWTTTHCTYHTVHLPHSAPTTQCTDPGTSPTTCCTYHTEHMQLQCLMVWSGADYLSNRLLVWYHGLFCSIIRKLFEALDLWGLKKNGVKCWFTRITGRD